MTGQTQVTYAYNDLNQLTSSTIAGGATTTYAYDAFGELVHQTGSRENNYLYTGQQFDAATGLYSLRARYYDPGAGRFLSYDTWPIDLQNPLELNRYGYAANNPVNFIDPGGQSLVESDFLEINSMAMGMSVRQYIRWAAKKSIFAFLKGMVLGVGGYLAGLVAYNILKGNSWLNDFDENDALAYAITGALLNLANFWIAEGAFYKSSKEYWGPERRYYVRFERRASKAKEMAENSQWAPLFGVGAVVGLLTWIFTAIMSEEDHSLEEDITSFVVNGGVGGTVNLVSNTRFRGELAVLATIAGNTFANLLLE